MFHALTLPEFQAIRRALAAGMRYTEIARELDLSVWTINRIASERRFQCDEIAESELPEDDAPPEYAARNLHRCPGCGAMIYIAPCLACQMATQTQPVPSAPEVDDEPEEEQVEVLTDKQRRWRSKQLRRLVFGEAV